MTNIVQTPAEEIELTDAQLEAIYGASYTDDCSVALKSCMSCHTGDDDTSSADTCAPHGTTTDAPPSSSVGAANPHIFLLKKQKEFVFLKKKDCVKVLHISQGEELGKSCVGKLEWR